MVMETEMELPLLRSPVIAPPFRHGFTTRQAAVTPEDDPLLLGRVENSFRSTGHLAVRIARVLLAAG